jgi:photosystem II stability/assembly factor-like uncharacterized protein
MRIARVCLLALWLMLTGCVGVASTPDVKRATSLPPTSPVMVPTHTLRPATSPVATPSPAPAAESRWVCYHGGVACYDDLLDISMLDAEEGWAVGSNNVVLHYTTQLDQAEPSWRQVYPFRTPATFNLAITAVGPNEWWGLHGASLVHYKEGDVQEFAVALVQDLAIVGEDEVWAVGDAGIFHYRQGNIEEAWRIGPEGQIFHYRADEMPFGPSRTRWQNVAAITMLNVGEGWAIANGHRLLHYQHGIWENAISFSDITVDPSVWIEDMAWVSEDEAWAVGTTIIHYLAGQWQVVKDDLGDATEGWAVGEAGRIMHYQNGRWQTVESPTQKRLTSISMVNPTEGWAVGDDSLILRYTNGKWIVVSDSQKPPGLSDIDWVGDEGWAVGVQGTILHYAQGEWQPVDSPLDRKLNINLNAVDMVNTNAGWAVGWSGTILRYNQGVWQLAPSPISQDLNGLDMVNEKEGWAVGGRARREGVIIHYSDGEWGKASIPTEQLLNDIDMINADEGWAVGFDGTILHYQNGVWQLVELMIDYDLYEIEMIDEDSGWILAGDNALLHYVNETWQEVTPPQECAPFTAMDVVSDREVWLSGTTCMLYYQDGRWVELDNPARTGMAKVLMLNEYEGWAVGDGILHYTNK